MNAMRVAVARAAVLTPLAAVQMRAASKKVVKKASPAKKVSAKKAVAKQAPAKKAAVKKAVAKKVKAEMVAAVKKAAAKKVKAAAAKKAAVQAKKAKNDKKKAIKATGASNPYALFVAQINSGAKGRFAMKDIAAKWKTLPAAEKTALQAQAKKNAAAKQKVKASFKKPASKYALFVKANFPAAYAAAIKGGANRKEAFKQATKEVTTKYKASK